MAEQAIPVQAYANGKPVALSTFTKAIYSLTPENEVGERLDNTLASLQEQINAIQSQMSTMQSQINLISANALPYDGAGGHNSVYRGKNLGTSVTPEQYNNIQNGTFKDLYIGDYWTINGTTYKIAHFDYYYNTGRFTPGVEVHHVTLVPSREMYRAAMNDNNSTEGGYVGSKMHTTNLAEARSTIQADFGSEHILSHDIYLSSETDGAGRVSSDALKTSTIELMTEMNVYGTKIFGNIVWDNEPPMIREIDKTQYALFRFKTEEQCGKGLSFWLRDVVDTTSFALASNDGACYYGSASNSGGVRPAFSIVA